MDLVGLQAALDKFNNITLPHLEQLLTRLEDETVKDIFAEANKLLDRLGIRNPEADQSILSELADIKHILARMTGIIK